MGAVDWGVMWYAAPYMAKGALITLEISALAMVAGCVIGMIGGLVSLSDLTILKVIVRSYVYFALPVIGIYIPNFWGGVIALAFNAGGFIAEIVRAGLESIDAGQSEAALAIGMTNRQRLLFVLLPQSLRRITPPLTNELITLVKGSSLLSTISIFELTRSTQVIIAQRFTPFELYALLAVFYLIIISPLSRLSEY